ncbi:uncharacterized protein LOC118341396 [Morone saxatilis]|uniref:uncharacterized protein LOC118341396 n=1 Tax=Morone saxatilis TaxID=34816 RepID=UPI0015E1E8E5|nr:uncharacterized protein LOC118341396 [Morone saxatilis]
MLTRWLTFTAFLACSANPERAAITVAPTCMVKGHPEVVLTLNCGDGKNAGVVQYWHTPFGDLQTPGFHSELDPVFMHHDGSLVVPNTSILHSGLYYCLLQHTEGTTLWPYQLHVGHNDHKNPEHSRYEQRGSCESRSRSRRDVGSEEERQAGVSDGEFAGAVAASVLLTFVFGFSAGALTRTHVLRCLGAVSTRLRSPWKQRCQTDTPEHASEVNMTTIPPTYDDQAFEAEQVWDDNSVNMETTISSTTSSPPAKPQRSFRNKRQEEQETTAYLEGCDYMKEEERKVEEREEEVVAGRSLEEGNKGCDGEAEETLGEDEGSKSETDEEECSEKGEEKDGRERKEETKEWRQEKEVEETGEQESKEEVEERRGKGGGGEAAPSRGRRSRVIRLYQYDEDGQRYCHLPAPEAPRPAPRLKQRSVSLTRLNAIMAAASAGPLDTRETGREGTEERPHFHMKI